MEVVDLKVSPRVETRNAVRRLRRAGTIPAVLYGASSSAVTITIDCDEFESKVAAIEGTHLIRLTSIVPELDGRLVLVKEVQRHPVHRQILHTDLYEVDINARIRLRIPLHLVGRARGVEMGGILQPIRRNVEVLCLPTNIPDNLEIDVSGLGIHDVIHLSDLTPPAGVEIPYEVDEALVTVLPPVVEEVSVPAEVPQAAAAATGESKTESPKT